MFSDDLSMEGVKVAGNYLQCAEATMNAECDMILACNNQQGAITILDNLSHTYIGNPRLSQLVHHMLPKDTQINSQASLAKLDQALAKKEKELILFIDSFSSRLC